MTSKITNVKIRIYEGGQMQLIEPKYCRRCGTNPCTGIDRLMLALSGGNMIVNIDGIRYVMTKKSKSANGEWHEVTYELINEIFDEKY